MGLFSRAKYKTLTEAVHAGDLRAVRKMLDQGADPNRYNPDDHAYPIHYAIHQGPEMVQLLIDHGADVNIPSARNGYMPLASAEVEGYTEVASILRRAGARLRADNDEFAMDPRFRLRIEERIGDLAIGVRIQYHNTIHTMDPETLADMVESRINYRFPPNMSLQQQEDARREIRVLILKELGLQTERDIPGEIEKQKREVEEAMHATGLSEEELTRRFLIHLIEEGKNPLADAPQWVVKEALEKYPDIVALIRQRFGGF